jgi:hypothetical protein
MMFIVAKKSGWVSVIDSQSKRAIALCRNDIAALLIRMMLEMYFNDSAFRAMVHRRLT